ncbi:hypothetical protein C7M61_002532 [Candidozyma pseudohaemuli]|uniref:MICOS complex subunit n=1 Tax=Candidozyma pseudohaemuli TaxID=418784 RepID=A0A2P7YRJ2_9ASCO|nr:hypothetical protein C7M61_002532 [[Candida] pseudohaemulonii]PSK38597.1 hypothetical protein C7M61_002532 [[Candida] pseudohaemulonii]
MGRSFYGDDEFVDAKPGYKGEISDALKEKESLHGNISFVEGMGIRSTPYLESIMNKTKTFIQDKFSIANAELGTQLSAFRNEFTNYMDEILSFTRDESELGVTIPTLVSAIVVNKKSAPLRIFFPLAVSAVSFRLAMPKTYGAVSDKVSRWEQEKYPDAYKQQQDLSRSARELAEQFRVVREQAKLDLQKNVHDARVYVTDLLKDDE